VKLTDYIKGKRHGKDANQLEREAMKDPFLNDAIEGFDAVHGDHFSAIRELEKKINEKQQKQNKTIYFRRWTIGIAATIALVLGIGGLLDYKFKTAPEIAVVTPKKETDTVKSATIKEHKVESTPIKTVPEKIISQNIKKKQIKTKQKSASKPDQELFEMESNEPPMQAEIASDSKATASVEIQDVDKSIPELRVVTSPATPAATALKPVSNTLQNKISGIIVDENNQPMIGATVQLKGTNSQTISDINGKYELTVPKDKTKDLKLVANYIGYNKKEFAANTDSNIIKLEPDNVALNEVVVIGYGVQKKVNMTGAVTSARNSNSFGTTEFKSYYEKKRNKELCNTFNTKLKASFYINDAGRPTEIKVEIAPCEEMEKEFITILQSSPSWTDKNKKEKITIRF